LTFSRHNYRADRYEVSNSNVACSSADLRYSPTHFEDANMNLPKRLCTAVMAAIFFLAAAVPSVADEPKPAQNGASKPLKVYILAGQSNMQGHVNVSTVDYMATDPGRQLIEKAVPAWEKAQRQATELLGSEGVALLDKAARKVGFAPAPQ
jgi:hypothetical protein